MAFTRTTKPSLGGFGLYLLSMELDSMGVELPIAFSLDEAKTRRTRSGERWLVNPSSSPSGATK
ncbi:MAG: hypothetical protein AB8G99_00460 [Planctomycetaceae bacterium]